MNQEYLRLFNAITDAVKLLQEAQAVAENLFLERTDPAEEPVDDIE